MGPGRSNYLERFRTIGLARGSWVRCAEGTDAICAAGRPKTSLLGVAIAPQLVLLEFVAELAKAETEEFRGPRLDALRSLEGLFEKPPLELVERCLQVQPRLGQVELHPPRLALPADRLWERLDAEHLPRPQDEGPLDDVFQLADVARPVVLLEQGQRLRGHAPHFAAERLAEFLEEVGDEERDVIGAFPERWKVNGDDVQRFLVGRKKRGGRWPPLFMSYIRC